MNLQLLSEIVVFYNAGRGRVENTFLDCFSALALDQPLNEDQKKAIAGAMVEYIEQCPPNLYQYILQLAKDLKIVSFLIDKLIEEINNDNLTVRNFYLLHAN